MKAYMTLLYEHLFWIIAGSLNLPALFFKTNYLNTNIVTYYFLIPLFWLIIINLYIALGFFIIFAIIRFTIKDWDKLCADLFAKSVRFLLFFQKIGWDYIKASVIICVFLPFIITNILLIIFHPWVYKILLF